MPPQDNYPRKTSPRCSHPGNIVPLLFCCGHSHLWQFQVFRRAKLFEKIEMLLLWVGTWIWIVRVGVWGGGSELLFHASYDPNVNTKEGKALCQYEAQCWEVWCPIVLLWACQSCPVNGQIDNPLVLHPIDPSPSVHTLQDHWTVGPMDHKTNILWA